MQLSLKQNEEWERSPWLSNAGDHSWPGQRPASSPLKVQMSFSVTQWMMESTNTSPSVLIVFINYWCLVHLLCCVTLWLRYLLHIDWNTKTTVIQKNLLIQRIFFHLYENHMKCPVELYLSTSGDTMPLTNLSRITVCANVLTYRSLFHRNPQKYSWIIYSDSKICLRDYIFHFAVEWGGLCLNVLFVITIFRTLYWVYNCLLGNER